MRNISNESKRDWDMIIMCFFLIGVLWFNTLTEPNKVEVAGNSETKEQQVVIISEKEEKQEAPTLIEEIVGEIIPNFASENKPSSDSKEIEVDCPNCGVHIVVEN